MGPPDSMLGHPEILVDPLRPTVVAPRDPHRAPRPNVGQPRDLYAPPRDPLDPSECFGVFWGGSLCMF